MAYFITDRCVGCQKCKVECPVGAISFGYDKLEIDEGKCISCGTCASICNVGAAVDEAASEPITPHGLIEKNCDLVVLGGGGAGLVAAARAASLTRKKVIVLEKNVKTGGGAWFAADFKMFNSKWQLDRGIPDVLEESLRAAMDATYWKLDPHLAEACFRGTGRFFNWLCETGHNVEDQFQEGVYIFDGPNGPKVPVFKKRRRGKQGGTGKFVMDQMLSLCRQLDVEVLTGTAATDLEVQDGRVSAVLGADSGGPVKINCKACILATGSWINHQEVLERVAPKFASMPTCRSAHRNPAYTGDGIRLARQAGAKIDYDSFCLRLMGPLMMASDGTPYDSFASMCHDPSVIYVNQNGKRWIDETAISRTGFFHTAETLLEQPHGISYTIFDTSCIEQAVEKFRSGPAGTQSPFGSARFPEDWQSDLEAALQEYAPWFKRADSPEELAALLGLPADALLATLERYNRQCADGFDHDFFKSKASMTPLVKPPYYAVICNMATDGAFGGVQVDSQMRVLREDGSPMDGFFAGGDFTSSRFLNLGGVKIQIINDLAWAFSSGFLAGESAAAYLAQ